MQLDAGTHQIVELWSAEPLLRLASVPHLRAAHLRIAVSDDAELVALTDRAQSGAAAAGRYRLWSRSRQADVLRQEGAEFVAFGPDRRHFAASDGVWRLAEGSRHEARRLLTWAEPPDSLAFGPSGRCVARRSGYDGGVDVHDLEPRLSEADFQTGNQARADGPTHLRVGKLSATLDKQYLVVSDGARNQAIARLEHPTTVQFGALSEDGQRAATVDEAGTLRVWTLAPADLIAQACARGPKPIRAATWAEYMPARVMEDTCHRQRPAVNALR